jgi:hypothetical protein
MSNNFTILKEEIYPLQVALDGKGKTTIETD